MTLGALAGARRAAAADPDPGRRRRLLAISVPEIPGASVLGHTELELAAVSPWVPANRPPLVGDAVTINSVTYILHEYDWLHIACHGTPPVPGKLPAQLWLSNNVLTVNRLAWEKTINSELAYLSGCHTATGSFEYPDEAEHLAGAFQATGYQHVIGTLPTSMVRSQPIRGLGRLAWPRRCTKPSEPASAPTRSSRFSGRRSCTWAHSRRSRRDIARRGRVFMRRLHSQATLQAVGEAQQASRSSSAPRR